MPHGHITSLAVLRTHRKCGLATKLMRAARMLLAVVFVVRARVLTDSDVMLRVRQSVLW